MGRLKKSKRNVIERNKCNLAKRYKKETVEVQDNSVQEPRPTFQPSNNHDEPSNSTGHEGRPNENKDSLLGFSLYNSYNEEIQTQETAASYVMVDVNLLTSFLCSFPCSECLNKTLMVSNTVVKGYAHILKLQCTSCLSEITFQTSEQTGESKANSTRAPYDINRRMVQAFTSLGKGYRGMEVLSMHLNSKPIKCKAFSRHLEQLHTTYLDAVEENLKKARCEVRKAYTTLENHPVDYSGPVDVTVSYDGSWQKRGFTSKNGVGCCVDVMTGLVIDYEVISKYCGQCEQMKNKLKSDSDEFMSWFASHKDRCQQNYSGSSPMMEVVAAERIWKRSMDYGFRFTTLVSDGDSKTFSHLSELKLYGEEVTLEKVECLNHVAKRLGTGLRKIVAEHTGTGEPLGGKKHGSLKKSTIDKLTVYYRNAIEKNLGNVNNMKTAIYASLFHCKSTDEHPEHHKCPKGVDSWCFYNRAIAKSEKPEPHKQMVKTPISEHIVSKVMPLYQRLASDSLLQRCVSGRTQNANEALHGVIWSKCPKSTFASRKKLEISVSEAICQYNTGCNKTIFDLQSAGGISPGTNSAKLAKHFDQKRLRIAKIRKTLKYAEYRRKVRQAKIREEERKVQEEGLSYRAGRF